jgi:hypothetical protein
MHRALRHTIICLGVIIHTHIALAQHVASVRPFSAVSWHDDSVSVFRVAPTQADSANRVPARAWPAYTVGGAVIGGVAVAAFALTHCDQGCKDDGALAFAPPFIAAGAVTGGLLGLGIGLIIDSSRRGSVGLRVSMRVP